MTPPPSKTSILIANLIYTFHVLLVLFILFGIFILPNKYLPYFTVFIILVIMGWNDLYGSCILTKLEYYYRYGIWSNKTALDDDGPEFFRPLIKSITGINMTRQTANNLNNTIFLSVTLITVIKFAYSVRNCRKL